MNKTNVLVVKVAPGTNPNIPTTIIYHQKKQVFWRYGSKNSPFVKIKAIKDAKFLYLLINHSGGQFIYSVLFDHKVRNMYILAPDNDVDYYEDILDAIVWYLQNNLDNSYYSVSILNWRGKPLYKDQNLQIKGVTKYLSKNYKKYMTMQDALDDAINVIVSFKVHVS